MTITLELSEQSCKDAIKTLKQRVNKSERTKKLDEVCKRLAEIGRAEAESHLILADGNTDARLDVVPTDNGYKIVMEGHDVYFIEFGTGNDVDAHYSTSVPVYPGSWSMEHSQRYAKDGWWFYQKQIYTGTPAYMPLYYAAKKIREERPRIMKEVFGK